MAPLGTSRTSTLRARLGAAACLLVAAGARSASAQAPDSSHEVSPKWQFDGAALLYGEKGRTQVVEPQARITRLFADGQILSATVGLDVMTGSSPTGALPSTTIQTSTTPSGSVSNHTANAIPLNAFNDSRTSLDLEWTKPFGSSLTTTLGSHGSIERDYRSLGGTARVSLAMMRKLTTVTIGAGYNEDRVDPVGGTRAPLGDGSVLIGTDPNPKRVRSGMVGVSRVLTRRWLVGVNGTLSAERGYLTDPYKVVSLLDSTGTPNGQLTESRPSSRTRRDVLASSVYHLTRDVMYASYRYYWDDWGVTSHTADARYRIELKSETYLQPHIRYYFQTRANFFQFGLPENEPLPEVATTDPRLGDLRTLTLGATYGFHPGSGPGELSLRAEYIRQWGKGSQGAGEIEEEGNAVPGNGLDLSPPVDIGTFVLGYSVPF